MKDSALTQVLLKKPMISLKEEVIGFFKLRSLFAFSIAQVLVALGWAELSIHSETPIITLF